jgi:FdhD protein
MEKNDMFERNKRPSPETIDQIAESCMNSFSEVTIIHKDGDKIQSVSIDLIGEEPLSIRIDGKPYSVVMRTPGDEIAHAAGFCLTEGIADLPEDITAIACCDGSDSNVVTVTLTEKQRRKIAGYLDRRGFISQTSCGICGKELVQDIATAIVPIGDDTRFSISDALSCLEDFSKHQPLRRKTRATHAALIIGAAAEVLSSAEDVGRHNAVDKAIGKLFLDHALSRAKGLVLSSRISYELVQKAARAGIPVILAVSRPTSLAVNLASRLNMTLACLAPKTGLYIFCGDQRLIV